MSGFEPDPSHWYIHGTLLNGKIEALSSCQPFRDISQEKLLLLSSQNHCQDSCKKSIEHGDLSSPCVIQEEKIAKALNKYGAAIKEVDINLSVSGGNRGKGDEKQKCEITIFLYRLGVVSPHCSTIPRLISAVCHGPKSTQSKSSIAAKVVIMDISAFDLWASYSCINYHDALPFSDLTTSPSLSPMWSQVSGMYATSHVTLFYSKRSQLCWSAGQSRGGRGEPVCCPWESHRHCVKKNAQGQGESDR